MAYRKSSRKSTRKSAGRSVSRKPARRAYSRRTTRSSNRKSAGSRTIRIVIEQPVATSAVQRPPIGMVPAAEPRKATF